MDKVDSLIAAVEQLKAELDIEPSIKAAGVPEKEFMNSLEQLSEDAFDDQCTGANPRYPLISELKQLYINAYNGKTDKK